MTMESDIFAQHSFGKAALKKLDPVPENFRLFSAAWIGGAHKKRTVMQVRGAEFRAAKSGPNKGRLCLRVPGTPRSVRVTVEEMRACG